MIVRRQPSMTFLGRVQGSDLSGQVVIPGPCCELVEAHRHTHPKGYMPPERSSRPELDRRYSVNLGGEWIRLFCLPEALRAS